MRESGSGKPAGGGKDDPTDAMYLARMLCERITTLTAWRPDDKKTRLLTHLSEQRRKMVGSQVKLRQQLTALLESYFSVVLELFGQDSQLPLLLGYIEQLQKRCPEIKPYMELQK